MSELVGWADDYFWGAMVVLRVFAVSLVLAVVIGLIGAAIPRGKRGCASRDFGVTIPATTPSQGLLKRFRIDSIPSRPMCKPKTILS